jgi:hypothetical protein
MVAFPRWLAPLLILTALCAAQDSDEFRAYTESPRLLLRPQRLRLLKRERDRQTQRWEHFHLLMSGGAQMAEPGFALALHYAVTGEPESARKAAEWAMTATDIRQTALVFDWCREVLPPAQSKTLSARLIKAAAASSGADFNGIRDRAFAAIAIADLDPVTSTRAMRDILQNAWRSRSAPILRDGAGLPPTEQLYALYEFLHAVRDNLNIDLREDVTAWFKSLAPLHMLSHYPATYPAPENDYRIPAYDANAEPDLRRAALSRATELSMVAFDSNASDTQFLQGWLMQDRFILRSTFGITYEYLWANPYQPGLSYHHFPLAYHDPRSGGLFARSSWEEDAIWLGKVGGEWQTFRDGKITVLNTEKRRDPVVIGETQFFVAHEPLRFQVSEASRAYLVGLKPLAEYDVEVDDEEMRESLADRAGTIEINLSPQTTAGIRLSPRR